MEMEVPQASVEQNFLNFFAQLEMWNDQLVFLSKLIHKNLMEYTRVGIIENNNQSGSENVDRHWTHFEK